MVLPPLKYTSTPCFLQMFLQLSPMPFYIWYYNVRLSGIRVIVTVGPFVVSLAKHGQNKEDSHNDIHPNGQAQNGNQNNQQGNQRG